MNCPICRHDESRVIRTVNRGAEIVRQRRCGGCGHSWETVEQSKGAIERGREVIAKARELADLVKEG